MAHRKHVNSVCWGRAIAAALTFIAIIAPCSSYAFGKQEPTAIIVDAETGKPIEGVIALAQWLRGSDKGSWFEGGRDELAKAKEAYADAEGKVRIDGFWGAYIFSRKPSLTVYKPGYILWGSTSDGTGGSLFYPRQEFTQKNNIIRLYKFETDYSKWLQQHPDNKYPHAEQADFFYTLTENAPCTGPHKVTICDVYLDYETKSIVKERNEEINERLKKIKK